jgi:hypothetical protein
MYEEGETLTPSCRRTAAPEAINDIEIVDGLAYSGHRHISETRSPPVLPWLWSGGRRSPRPFATGGTKLALMRCRHVDRSRARTPVATIPQED